MRPVVLLIALSMSNTADANRRQKARLSTAAEASNSATRSGVADGGTLLDYVARPAAESKPASEEPIAARITEEEFAPTIAIHGRPDAGFYIDPAATLDVDPLHLSRIDPADFDIPIVINDDVKRWMSYYNGRGRGYFTKWLERRGRYETLMTTALADADLPLDLIYLSMIESGYKTHAYSRAAAAGLWQFIAPTATGWGLRVDWWVDDRRDPEMATLAATRFLGHLYKKYDDWYLAWAAYNGGPGRVDRAIKKYGTRDFWELVEKGAFPAETDNYVPKLLAAAIVAHYPERYGFTDIEELPPIAYDTVSVEPSIGIDVLARCAGTTAEVIQELNPNLRRWALPPEPAEQWLRVPKGTSASFTAALSKVPASERLSFHEHKVAKGESLGMIAARYGVSVGDIQKVNRIDNPNKITVGMRLVVPGPGGAISPSAMVSVAGGGSKTSRTKQISHVVRSGESLSTIAVRYGVKQSDLMRWNGVEHADKIRAGQKLKLFEPASQWKAYTVRSGDTLSSIAARNQCTIDELQSWNNLKGSRIYAGQKLKIRNG
jgi:membrane-bound lytic murein transglycosylase D